VELGTVALSAISDIAVPHIEVFCRDGKSWQPIAIPSDFSSVSGFFVSPERRHS
jgi:hypothetical protein